MGLAHWKERTKNHALSERISDYLPRVTRSAVTSLLWHWVVALTVCPSSILELPIFPVFSYHYHLTHQWVLVTWWHVPCFLKFLFESSPKSSASSAPVKSRLSNPPCMLIFKLVCDVVTLSITLRTKRVSFNRFCVLLGLIQLFSSDEQSLFTCTL